MAEKQYVHIRYFAKNTSEVEQNIQAGLLQVKPDQPFRMNFSSEWMIEGQIGEPEADERFEVLHSESAKLPTADLFEKVEGVVSGAAVLLTRIVRDSQQISVTWRRRPLPENIDRRAEPRTPHPKAETLSAMQ